MLTAFFTVMSALQERLCYVAEHRSYFTLAVVFLLLTEEGVLLDKKTAPDWTLQSDSGEKTRVK